MNIHMELHSHELHNIPSASSFDLSCRSSKTSGTVSRCWKAGWCTMCPAGTVMGCPLSSKHWETWEPVGWLLYRSDRKVRKSHIINILAKVICFNIKSLFNIKLVLFCFCLIKNCLCVSVQRGSLQRGPSLGSVLHSSAGAWWLTGTIVITLLMGNMKQPSWKSSWTCTTRWEKLFLYYTAWHVWFHSICEDVHTFFKEVWLHLLCKKKKNIVKYLYNLKLNV